VEKAEPQGGLDGRRAKVALDALEDRLEPDELPGRVKVEQAVDERVAGLQHREPVTQPVPNNVGPVRCGAGTLDVVGVDGRGALVAAPALAATDVAAVLLADRDCISPAVLACRRDCRPSPRRRHRW